MALTFAAPLSLAFAPSAALAPSTRAIVRAEAPMMAKSEALPFLEAPAHCDGTYAGDVGFDPFNFGGMYSIKWMREAEIKHGRVCMLAFLGYIAVDCGIRVPYAPAVSSLAAHDVTVKGGQMLLLLFVIAIFEAVSYSAIGEMMSGETDREPGDYGIDWQYCKPGDTATQAKYRLAEITHCRAAMIGFSGMVTQAALTEGPFPYNTFS
jgi:hypothetical protein